MTNVSSIAISLSFYKLAYRTNDLAQSFSYCKEELGFEEFLRAAAQASRPVVTRR